MFIYFFQGLLHELHKNLIRCHSSGMVSKTFHALSPRYRTILLHVPRHVLSSMLFAPGVALVEHCDIGGFPCMELSGRSNSPQGPVNFLTLFLPGFVFMCCLFFSGVLNNLQHYTIKRVLSFTVFAFSRTAPINAFSWASARGCPSPSDHAMLTCFLQALTPLLRGSAPLTTRYKRNCLSHKFGMSLQVQRLSEKQQSNAES